MYSPHGYLGMCTIQSKAMQPFFVSPTVQILVKLSQKERNSAAVEAIPVGRQPEGALF